MESRVVDRPGVFIESLGVEAAVGVFIESLSAEAAGGVFIESFAVDWSDFGGQPSAAADAPASNAAAANHRMVDFMVTSSTTGS
jgi:hypothetical protein